MATTLSHETGKGEPTIAELASGIVDDAQRWFRQELTLAKREVEYQWDRTKTAAVLLVVGSTMILFAGILLSFAIVHFLADRTILNLWQGFLVVGLAVTVAAGVLIYRGVRKLQKVTLIPQRAVESIQEVAGGD